MISLIELELLELSTKVSYLETKLIEMFPFCILLGTEIDFKKVQIGKIYLLFVILQFLAIFK